MSFAGPGWLRKSVVHAAALALALLSWTAASAAADGQAWVPLSSIDEHNVWQLRQAWWSRGDAPGDRPMPHASVSPLHLPGDAGGALLGCLPGGRVVSLAADTGETRWERRLEGDDRDGIGCRGLAFWQFPAGAAGADAGHCVRRVFAATGDGRVHALDAGDGRHCEAFADDGRTPAVATGTGDLRWFLASPLLVGDVLIHGHAGSSGGEGALRAIDARSGQPLWDLAIGRDFPGDSVRLVADEALGLVYVPTPGGSPGSEPDRSSAVLALTAATGEPAWQYDLVRDDVWQSDPALLTLIGLDLPGGRRPAVVALTARSLLFVLDRRRGEALLPVRDRSADGDGVPAQPFPERPPQLVRPAPGVDEAFGLGFWDESRCRRRLRESRLDEFYPRPAPEPAIEWPAGHGAGRRGLAFDPQRGRLIAAFPEVAARLRMATDDQDGPARLDHVLFRSASGTPCTPPPWSRIVGVDLPAGEVAWEAPLGTLGALEPLSSLVPRIGGRMDGGLIVTASGLIFSAAGADERLRAWETDSGRQLWSRKLPGAGLGDPVSYEAGGRQYLALAVRAREDGSDGIVAWALPEAPAGALQERLEDDAAGPPAAPAQ